MLVVLERLIMDLLALVFDCFVEVVIRIRLNVIPPLGAFNCMVWSRKMAF